MKTFNFYQIIASLIIILSLTSCIHESELELQDNTSSFKIIPFSQEKSATYTDNYMVSEETTTIDIENNKINLEIPIPESDFQLLRTYNISTENNAAILYLIGRNNTIEVVSNPINYVIQDEINISELGLDTNLLQNGNGLRIFVMNNSQEINTNSDIYNCISDKVDTTNLNDNKCGDNNKSADGPKFYNGGIILI